MRRMWFALQQSKSGSPNSRKENSNQSLSTETAADDLQALVDEDDSQSTSRLLNVDHFTILRNFKAMGRFR